MHNEITAADGRKLYYRYNPQADILAIRLRPEFKTTEDRPVQDLPGVSTSHDPKSGEQLGLRIEGVQRMILDALVQDVFSRVEGQQAIAEAGLQTDSPTDEASPSRGSETTSKADQKAAPRAKAKSEPSEKQEADRQASDEESEVKKKKKKRRRKRKRKKKVDSEARDEDKSGLKEAPKAGAAKPDPAALSDTDGSPPPPPPEASPEEPPSTGLSDQAAAKKNEPSENSTDADPASDPAEMAEQSSTASVTPVGFAPLGLDERVGGAIGSLGFESPTPIQSEAIPAAVAGRDIIGLAQTGTGKTLAFLAPAIHRLLAAPDSKHQTRLLVLAPTRELTKQVGEQAEALSKPTGLRVATIYGGVGMGPQVQALRRGADLVIATPGRMLDHLRRGNLSCKALQTLVLDEADRMLDMGFLPDIRAILRFLPRERQTLFFTATMPPEIEALSMEFQREPAKIEIARRKPPEQIDQRLYPVGKHLKAALLVHLLEAESEGLTRALVFTERKVDADVLARKLRLANIGVALMHGDRRQRDREQALARLARGDVKVLVATNVAARGLDIDGISHVINFDIPQTVDEYVHRIGRTARAEADGKAYSFVTVSDEGMVSRIEGALERELPRVKVEEFDYDVPTPSWAKPSAKDVMDMLNKEQSVTDRLKHLGRRR